VKCSPPLPLTEIRATPANATAMPPHPSHVSRSPRKIIESSATNTGPAEMSNAAAPELTVCSPKFSDTW